MDSPHFWCGLDSLAGAIHLKSHTVRDTYFHNTPENHELALEALFPRMWMRPEESRPALCLPS